MPTMTDAAVVTRTMPCDTGQHGKCKGRVLTFTIKAGVAPCACECHDGRA